MATCQEAESWLLDRLAKLKIGAPTRYTFDQAAVHYVTLYYSKPSFELEQWLCGARDAVVCGPRWQWEVRLEELGVSAFVVPRLAVKGRKRNRVLVCNSVGQSIVESVRGHHPALVFVYSERREKCEPGPIQSMTPPGSVHARTPG